MEISTIQPTVALQPPLTCSAMIEVEMLMDRVVEIAGLVPGGNARTPANLSAKSIVAANGIERIVGAAIASAIARLRIVAAAEEFQNTVRDAIQEGLKRFSLKANLIGFCVQPIEAPHELLARLAANAGMTERRDDKNGAMTRHYTDTVLGDTLETYFRIAESQESIEREVRRREHETEIEKIKNSSLLASARAEAQKHDMKESFSLDSYRADLEKDDAERKAEALNRNAEMKEKSAALTAAYELRRIDDEIKKTKVRREVLDLQSKAQEIERAMELKTFKELDMYRAAEESKLRIQEITGATKAIEAVVGKMKDIRPYAGVSTLFLGENEADATTQILKVLLPRILDLLDARTPSRTQRSGVEKKND